MFARSKAGLSSAFALAMTYRYDVGMDGYETAARAFELAEGAVALDPNSADAFATRGYIGILAGAPMESVEVDFETALQLQPNAPNAPSWQGRVLARTGRSDEAFEKVLKGVALDPLHAGRRIAVAYLALHQGSHDLAIEHSRAALRLEPELMLARAIEGRSLLLSGRAGECASADLGPYGVLKATCIYETGDVVSALAIVDSVVGAIESGATRQSPFTDVLRMEDLAAFYAWTEDARASLLWIERAYELSPTGIEVRVLESGLFDRVRSDPGFLDEVARFRSGIWGRVSARRAAIR